jgi:hypothetical protein
MERMTNERPRGSDIDHIVALPVTHENFVRLIFALHNGRNQDGKRFRSEYRWGKVVNYARELTHLTTTSLGDGDTAIAGEPAERSNGALGEYEGPSSSPEVAWTEVGWTAEEYAKCPEVIDRLHTRILDLQDALDRAQQHLDEVLYKRMVKLSEATKVDLADPSVEVVDDIGLAARLATEGGERAD